MSSVCQFGIADDQIWRGRFGLTAEDWGWVGQDSMLACGMMQICAVVSWSVGISRLFFTPGDMNDITFWAADGGIGSVLSCCVRRGSTKHRPRCGKPSSLSSQAVSWFKLSLSSCCTCWTGHGGHRIVMGWLRLTHGLRRRERVACQWAFLSSLDSALVGWWGWWGWWGGGGGRRFFYYLPLAVPCLGGSPRGSGASPKSELSGLRSCWRHHFPDTLLLCPLCLTALLRFHSESTFLEWAQLGGAWDGQSQSFKLIMPIWIRRAKSTQISIGSWSKDGRFLSTWMRKNFEPQKGISHSQNKSVYPNTDHSIQLWGLGPIV